MRLKMLGSLAVASVLALGCELPPTPTPTPSPDDSSARVTMRAELVRPHPVTSRRFDGDGFRYVRAEMTVSDARLSPLCDPRLIRDQLRYQTRKVTRPDGVKLELWVVGGVIEFSTRRSSYCWKKEEMPAGLYGVGGSATYTDEPRPGAPTTTTVPCTVAPFVPGGNAGDVPPLCSEPLDPIYWPVALRAQSSAFRFVK